MRREGFSFLSGGLGVELCLPTVGVAFAAVRKSCVNSVRLHKVFWAVTQGGILRGILLTLRRCNEFVMAGIACVSFFMSGAAFHARLL